MENKSKQEKSGLFEIVKKNTPAIMIVGGALLLTAMDCITGAYYLPGKNVPAIHKLDSTYSVSKHTNNPMNRQEYFAKRNALWEDYKHSNPNFKE